MAQQHTIEVFASGCPACDDVIVLVNRVSPAWLAPPSPPSVVIDGKVASCCAARGIDEAALRTELE